jgi:hypothetical protein
MEWKSWFNDCGKCPAGWGIYRVRMVDAKGRPVPLQRLCGVDRDGIIYIGRSGKSTCKSDRSTKKRLGEFFNHGSHSGSWTYWQAKKVFQRLKKYEPHRIEAAVICLKDDDIYSGEKRALRAYFEEFGELPPFNSSWPGKWD